MKTELSACQKRFWLENLLHPDDSNNIAAIFRMGADFNTGIFCQALMLVTKRVESLCSVYRQEGGIVFMERRADLCIRIEDKVIFDVNEADRVLDDFGRQLFRLEVELPMRVLLLKLPDGKYCLEIVFHHICMDAVSNLDLFGMITNTYEILSKGGAVPQWKLPAFKDYQAFEKLVDTRKQAGLCYWSEFFKEHPTGIVFPRNRIDSEVGGELDFQLGKRLNLEVGKTARRLNTTPFLLLMSAWQWVLSAYSGCRRVTVSYAVNIRPPALRGLIGPFVNNLPCSVSLEENPLFLETVAACTSQRKMARPFQRVITTDIVECLRRSELLQPGEPFLNAAINYVEWGQSQPLALKGAEVVFLRRVRVNQHFDIVLEIEPTGFSCCRIIFNEKFESVFIGAMQRSYIRVLLAVTGNPVLRFSEVSFLSPGDCEKAKGYAGRIRFRLTEKLPDFLSLFARSVGRNPEHTALIFGDTKVTYRQLNDRSNHIAAVVRSEYIRITGIPILPGTPIGICLGRECDFVAAILGVMKAGAAYVPLDPSNPSVRLSLIVEGCGIQLTLTSQAIAGKSGSLAEIYPEAMKMEKPEVVLPVPRLCDTAYIIYTSGTTGIPKGVPISYLNLYFLIQNALKWLKITRRTIQLEYAPISFDASIVDVFPALVKGATVVIASDLDRSDPIRLATLIREEHIDTAYIAPAMLAQMHEDIPGLKTIIVAGETTPADVVTKWAGSRRLLNLYGPTENTVFSTGALLSRDTPVNDIGKPIAGVTCYVLDEYGRLVPEGVPGELYIGGMQLTNGYINRPELNREKFIVNPFVRENEVKEGINCRLYKTGDLVRRLSDKHFLFLGRIDSQIKIHGFRIEPGEIESCLNSFEGINQSVVVLKELRKIKRLVAYVQSDSPECIAISGLRDFVGRRLPSWMVPAIFVVLKEFPQTQNGKIDRQCLPEPIWQEREYIAPVTSLEIILARIVVRLLGVEKVGITDDLFALGLTSLSVVTFVHEAENCGFPVSVSVVYTERTIRGIATYRKQGICRWFRDERTDKPVVVLVCGHMDFGEMLHGLAEVLNRRFAVLILESYHNYPERLSVVSFSELLALYIYELDKLIFGRHVVYAFSGHCFGGEIAYALAILWQERQLCAPRVWMFNSLAHRQMLPDRVDINLQNPDEERLYNEAIIKKQMTDKLVATETLSDYIGEILLFIPLGFTAHLLSPALPAVANERVLNRIRHIYKKNPEAWKRLAYRLEVCPLEGNHWTLLASENIEKIFNRIIQEYDEAINIKE